MENKAFKALQAGYLYGTGSWKRLEWFQTCSRYDFRQTLFLPGEINPSQQEANHLRNHEHATSGLAHDNVTMYTC